MVVLQGLKKSGALRSLPQLTRSLQMLPPIVHTERGRQTGEVFRIAAEAAEVKRSCLPSTSALPHCSFFLVFFCVFVGTLQMSLGVLRVSQHGSSQLASVA